MFYGSLWSLDHKFGNYCPNFTFLNTIKFYVIIWTTFLSTVLNLLLLTGNYIYSWSENGSRRVVIVLNRFPNVIRKQHGLWIKQTCLSVLWRDQESCIFRKYEIRKWQCGKKLNNRKILKNASKMSIIFFIWAVNCAIHKNISIIHLSGRSSKV